MILINQYISNVKSRIKNSKTNKIRLTHEKSVNSIEIMQNHDFTPKFIRSINTIIDSQIM